MERAPLFRRGSNPQTEAVIGGYGYDDRLIADGFRSAAIILVDAIKKGGPHPHLLAYPIVFNYRHFVELELKTILRILRSYITVLDAGAIDSALARHDLQPLLDLVLAGVATIEPEIEAYPETGQLRERIAELNAMDSGSFAFRYLRTKSGNRYITPYTTFDIPAFADEMEAVAGSLYAIERACMGEKLTRIQTWLEAVDHDVQTAAAAHPAGGAVIEQRLGQWTRAGSNRWAQPHLTESGAMQVVVWDEASPNGRSPRVFIRRQQCRSASICSA